MTNEQIRIAVLASNSPHLIVICDTMRAVANLQAEIVRAAPLTRAQASPAKLLRRNGTCAHLFSAVQLNTTPHILQGFSAPVLIHGRAVLNPFAAAAVDHVRTTALPEPSNGASSAATRGD